MSQRIIILSQTPPPIHGSSVMTTKLIDTLRKCGWEVDVVNRGMSRHLEEVGKFSLSKLVRVPRFLRASLRGASSRPELLISFTSSTPFAFVLEFVALLFFRVFRIPTVHYLHTNTFEDLAQKGIVWEWAVRSMFNSSQCVIALSPTLASSISRLTSTPVEVISNFVDESYNYSSYSASIENERDTVCFLSNFIEGKGADIFVDLAIELAPHYPDIKWIAAGGPITGSIWIEQSERVSTLGLANIELPGYLDDLAKYSLLKRSLFMVFLSSYKHEALPLVIIEAFRERVPVIATNVGGVSDMVTSGVNGILVPPGDIEAAKSAILRLLNDESLRSALGKNARRSFETHYSYEIYESAWRNLLDEALSR